MKKNTITLLLLLIVILNLTAKEYKLLSPNGNLCFYLQDERPNGELAYEIKYKDQPVILLSSMGISGWENKLELEKIKDTTNDEVWKQVYGERAEVRDHYNQKTFIVKKTGRGDKLNIEVRAYNEGIAFRYVNAGNGYQTIKSENTTFVTPPETYCWFAPFAQSRYTYLPIRDWPGESERPLTMKLKNGLYTCLAEAEMVNYCRTKFVVNKGEENIIRCKMYENIEDIAPFATPWRVIMVAEKPAELLANNDIILNLNAPNKIKDTSWIKPGKIFRITRLTTEAAKKCIDFAAERSIEYVHFDAGWYGSETSRDSDPRKSDVDPARCDVNDLNIPEVTAYAKTKGIGVWLYVNQRALDMYLDEILPLYQSWGIAGIKFGFVHVGNVKWTYWLHEAVKKCAAHNLMVDIHDEYRPTGFSRTYPNLLTQEGICGNEEFPDGNTTTTLPFTRFICGAGDATICYFHRRELKEKLPLNARSLESTACHQLALSIIEYSPLQFIYWYDSPEDVYGVPEIAYFDQLPTVWDDTKVLNGEIGKNISIARKKDGVWFVGCITNNDARKQTLALDFLDPAKKYEMTLYTDGGEKVKTRTHVAVETKQVNTKTQIKLDMLPRGGVAMIIKEK